VKGKTRKRRAFALAQLEPGHVIAVVLQLTDNDFISRLDERFAKGIGDQFNRFRGATRKDDLMSMGCVDKARHLLARGFVHICGAYRQRVTAAVHIAVYECVIIAQGVNNKLRFLGGSRVVQINKRMVVNPGR
jgi:hypothetical protein